MKTYQERIALIAPLHDPRHIEAYMRVEHGTLDQLPPSRFKAEVMFCCQCVDEGGIEMAERVAQSYGL